jgi:hypothetical protein
VSDRLQRHDPGDDWDHEAQEPVNPEVERRLAVLGRRLEELGHELAEVRRLAEGAPLATPTPIAPPPPPPRPAPPKPIPSYPAPAKPERGPSFWDRDVDFGELLGAKGLAWAGGIVTVLGSSSSSSSR